MNQITGNYSPIDFTFLSSNLASISKWEVLDDNLGSDHHIIRTTIQETLRQDPPPSDKLNFRKANWDIYKQEIAKRLSPNLPHTDLNENTDYIIRNIMETAKIAIPIKKPVSGRILIPYWNEECEKVIKARNIAQHEWRKKKTEENKVAYKTAKRHAQYTIRKEQDKYWRNYCSNLDVRTTPGEIWDTVRKLQGNNKPRQIPNIPSPNGNPLSNDEITKQFASFFATSNSDDNYTPQFLRKKANHTPINIPTDIQEHPMSDCITTTEVRRALRTAGNSSPGSDEVSYEMLRQLPPPALQALTNLLNQSWLTGNIPSAWKKATVIPAHKPNKPTHLCNSYRPISLTSVICKILEKILAHRLNIYLEYTQAYNPTQTGFRQNRGCSDQIARLAHDAALATEKYATLAVFLDVEKAFDMVWREGIITRMAELQIPNRMIKWTREFLTNRTLEVRIGRCTSDPVILQNGTPQGSVLSPLLFNIIMSSIPTFTDIKSSIYADDIALWTIDNNIPNMITNIQNHLNIVNSHLSSLGFKISPEKSQSMLFTRSAKIRKEVIQLYIAGNEIQRVKTAKFLGVVFDELSNWNSHIASIKHRCEKRINAMKSMAGLKWGINKPSLLAIYRATIRPILDYGGEGIDYAPAYIKKALDTIQYRALAVCCGSIKGTPTAALQVECGEIPLDLRRRRHITHLAIKSLLTPNNPLKDTYFPSSNTPEWKKQREEKLRAIQARKNPNGSGPLKNILDNILNPTPPPVNLALPASPHPPRPHPRNSPAPHQNTTENSHPPITLKALKNITLNEIMTKWQKLWDEEITGRALYDIQNLVNTKTTQYNTHREKEVLITRLRLGHCRTNGTLHKLKLHPSGHCNHCPGVREDVNHIILQCPARAALQEKIRTQTEGAPTLREILESRPCQDIIFTWMKDNYPQGL